MGHLRRYRRVIVALVAAIAVVISVSYTGGERQALTLLESLFFDATRPVQQVLVRATNLVAGYAQVLTGFSEMRLENERLQRDLSRLEQLEEEVRLLTQENARLRSLLGLRGLVHSSGDLKAFTVTVAEVVARNPDNWFSLAVINKGEADGVERNMVAVVAPKALVGRVVKVTGTTATLMLLTDPESGVGAMVQPSGDMGVVVARPGDPHLLEMRFFDRTASPEPGQGVVTSGLGSLFPKGLLVGIIKEVSREESTGVVTAEVRPLADMTRLQEVLVLARQRDGGEQP